MRDLFMSGRPPIARYDETVTIKFWPRRRFGTIQRLRAHLAYK